MNNEIRYWRRARWRSAHLKKRGKRVLKVLSSLPQASTPVLEQFSVPVDHLLSFSLFVCYLMFVFVQTTVQGVPKCVGCI